MLKPVVLVLLLTFISEYHAKYFITTRKMGGGGWTRSTFQWNIRLSTKTIWLFSPVPAGACHSQMNTYGTALSCTVAGVDVERRRDKHTLSGGRFCFFAGKPLDLAGFLVSVPVRGRCSFFFLSGCSGVSQYSSLSVSLPRLPGPPPLSRCRSPAFHRPSREGKPPRN